MKKFTSDKRLLAPSILALLAVLLSPGAFLSKSAKQQAPAWSVDLHAFGSPGDSPREWPPRSWNWKGPLEPPDTWFWQRGIAFTDENTLAVYFVLQQEPTQLPVRDSPQPSDPFQLRGIFFDATSGRVKHEQQWSTAAGIPSGIFATHDGRFVVLVGQHLTLYSSDFNPLKQLSLPAEEGRELTWLNVQVSPTGQFLFLDPSLQRGRRILRLNADRLEQLNTWAWDGDYFYTSMGEDTLARQEEHIVLVRSVGGPWKC